MARWLDSPVLCFQSDFHDGDAWQCNPWRLCAIWSFPLSVWDISRWQHL